EKPLVSGLSKASQSLRDCLARYHMASSTYDEVAADSAKEPLLARKRAQELVHTCFTELSGKDPCAIRLLSGSQAGSAAAHAVNVMVLAMLLGKTLDLQEQTLQD